MEIFHLCIKTGGVTEHSTRCDGIIGDKRTVRERNELKRMEELVVFYKTMKRYQNFLSLNKTIEDTGLSRIEIGSGLVQC